VPHERCRAAHSQHGGGAGAQHALRLSRALEDARGTSLRGSAFGKAVKLLTRYTLAVVDDPQSPKFRAIFASNPTLIERLGACPAVLYWQKCSIQ
jgi:hypothetical protein